MGRLEANGHGLMALTPPHMVHGFALCRLSQAEALSRGDTEEDGYFAVAVKIPAQVREGLGGPGYILHLLEADYVRLHLRGHREKVANGAVPQLIHIVLEDCKGGPSRVIVGAWDAVRGGQWRHVPITVVKRVIPGASRGVRPLPGRRFGPPLAGPTPK